MTAAQSAYLNQRQLRALERLGDLVLPGGEGMPSFSATGSLAHVDKLLAVTPAQDVRDLRLLLSLLSRLPDLCLYWLLNLIEMRERLPALIAAPLRLFNIGLKGILFSLYYSGLPGPYQQGETVLARMQYELHCEPDAARSQP